MLEAARDKNDRATLVDVIDRLLDKGLVINADITVSVAKVEMLGVKVRAALASFATAAKYGLEWLEKNYENFREKWITLWLMH